MTYETLLVDVREGVASVTLNRPDVRNALSATLIRELEQALAVLEADPEARVIVLAGAGDKAFCAGADLKGMADRGTTLQAREAFGGLARILESMARMRTPLIAKVHGYALAGGCGLAAGCDIVVAAEDAVFGLPEIKIGRPRAGQGGGGHLDGHGVRCRPSLPARAAHPGRPLRRCAGRHQGLLREARAELDGALVVEDTAS